jgi:hypothetical protein
MKHLLYSYAPNKLLNQSEREEPDKQKHTQMFTTMLRVNQRKENTPLNHRAATYGVGAPWASHISLRPRAHSKFIKDTASGHSQIILLIEHEKEFSGGPPLQSNDAAREPHLSSLFSSISSYLLSLHLFLFHPFSVSLPTVLSSGCRFVCLPFSHLLSSGASCFTFNSFSYFLRLLSFSLLVKIRGRNGVTTFHNFWLFRVTNFLKNFLT